MRGGLGVRGGFFEGKEASRGADENTSSR